MNKEDLERMAREAGFYVTDTCPLEPEWFHFAALVAAAERDRICKQIAQLHDALSMASSSKVRARSNP